MPTTTERDTGSSHTGLSPRDTGVSPRDTGLSPREELLALLASDLEAYTSVCLKIKDEKAKLVPLEFNPAQRIVHEKLERQLETEGRVRAVILKARQTGISTYVAARFFHRAHLKPEQSAFILADLKKRSEALWKIYKRYSDELPKTLRWPGKHTRHVQELVLENGSSIRVETAEDTQAGRAVTLQMVHASELAFWEYPEEVWTAISQAVPEDGTEIIVESTANGVGNFFHMFWEEAYEGRSGWLPIFLPWWIHETYSVEPTEDEVASILASEDPWERQALDEGFPYEGEVRKLDVRQLAWRRRIIRSRFLGDERRFRQEFPAFPEEAFLASGNQFLEEDLLERMRKRTRPAARGNLVRVNSGLVFRRAEGGYLRVFEFPDVTGHYVIGADTASGRLVGPTEDVASERGGRDFSCARVIRLPYLEGGTWTQAKVVAELHGRMVPEVFAAHLWDLGLYYSCPRPDSKTLRHPALIAVERNHASGEAVLKILDEKGYPELYVHRHQVRIHGRPTKLIGWVTDGTTRRLMLDELAAALRADELVEPSADCVREWRTFVRGEDGQPAAQAGCHDDRIMATAIAYQMLHFHPRHGG